VWRECSREGYLETGPDGQVESILSATPCRVNALLEGGKLRRWPDGPAVVLLTELKVIVACADAVRAVEWFRVVGASIEEARFVLTWLGPDMTSIESWDLELDPKWLKKNKHFGPLVPRLLELTFDALTPAQQAQRRELLALLQDRDEKRIDASEFEARVGEVLHNR
jgi:hypothetical protein